MAVIPDIQVSTRKIETRPEYRYTPSNRGTLLMETGELIGDTTRRLGEGYDRILEVKKRSDEREAEYAVMKATDFVKNGWNGYDKQNAETGAWEHTPGVVDRTWRELEADKTTVLDEERKLVSAVREQDFYTKLTPAQKKVFERKFGFKENEFHRAASSQHRKNVATRIADETKENIEWRGKLVGEVYGDDAEFDKRSQWAATRNYVDLLGSAVENPEIFDGDGLNFESAALDGKIRWRGGKLSDEELEKKIEGYREVVAAFHVNRITALQQAGAGNQSIGGMDAEQCLKKADLITQGLERGGFCTDAQANAIRVQTEKARKSLDAHRVEAQKEVYNKACTDNAKIALDMADPKKVADVKVNYEQYVEDFDKNYPGVSEAQKVALCGDYLKLCNSQEKYRADLKKFMEADAEHRAMYGEVDSDTGVFLPASMWAKETNPKILDEFEESSAIWGDTRSALTKLESARMTGMVKKDDYYRIKKLLRVKSDEEANKVWEQYGLPTIEELKASGYGLEKDALSDKQKKWRKANAAAWESWGGGIWAKTKGSQGGSAASWLADSLQHTEDEGRQEELIDSATWAKVYDMAYRLKANGVALPDAIRQIVAPTLQAGVERTLAERLSQADYFNQIIASSHAETGFVNDLNQMNEYNLIRQGRGKEIDAAKYSDLGNGLRMTKDGSGTIVDDRGNVVTKEHLKNIGGQLYDDIDISNAPEL